MLFARSFEFNWDRGYINKFCNFVLYALIFGCVWYLIKRYEKIPLVTFMGVSAGVVAVKNWILFIAGA